MPRIALAAICGAVFGLTNILTVADISSAAVGGYDPFDQWFSGYWRTVILFAGAPAAVIGCALFFGFLCGIGVLAVPAAVGIGGGALVALLVGPPESWLGGYPPIEALLRIFWEWLMAGVGGVVGWLVENLYERYS
jgi:hypothetical protein